MSVKSKEKNNIGLDKKRLTNSFKYAFNGIISAYKDEQNIKIHTIVAVLVLILGFHCAKGRVKEEYIDEKAYPVQMSDYILKYFDENNIDIKDVRLYNEYNYGSYLLFRGIPVFIDSRAYFYSPEFNEGVDIFNDYLNLAGLSIDNVEEVLDKYGITHLIMYKDAKLRTFIKQDKEKYEQLYEDDHFCIYERKQV